jgi:hypothetical protein
LTLEAAIICGVYAVDILWFDYLNKPISGDWRYAYIFESMLWMTSSGVNSFDYLTINKCPWQAMAGRLRTRNGYNVQNDQEACVCYVPTAEASSWHNDEQKRIHETTTDCEIVATVSNLLA